MDWCSVAVWAGLLASLRAGTADFALRPERWETRATIPVVERVLREPFSGPGAVDDLGKRVENAKGSAGLIAAGFESLGVAPLAQAPPPPPAATPGLPRELAEPVARLVARLTASRADLRRAVDSLSPEERERARLAADSAISDSPFLGPAGADYDAAVRFDLPRLAAAGVAAAGAVDEVLPILRSVARKGGPSFSARWDSAIGTVIVSSGDVELESADLANAGLIVRLGGRTLYRGPAAAASEGKIRVVVDLGGPVVVESTGPSAGSGDFGIGLLYLLGEGTHSVDVGERSLGAARFGVGFAEIDGDASRLASRRFGEGAAAFGVGVLDTRGDAAALRLPLSGQGFGTVRGAGFWRHRGASLTATCGFEIPDAREPLGSVSLGQGAGIGPRAFAAGGVGVAFIDGADARLTGSYFAQGSGYWHGEGALFIRGDRAHLQSRRYGLGSGIHAGIGALDIQGSRVQIEAWGVGPAFGWDYGVGLFRLRGDDARLRSDWANGRSELGGRALAWIEGDRNEIFMSEIGTGNYLRAQAGYALAVVKGRGNRLRATGLAAPVFLAGIDWIRNPWGAVRVEGDLTLDPALSLPDPTWTSAQRSARAASEAARVESLLASRPGESQTSRLKRLLFAAAADILDTRPAEGSARALCGLDENDARPLAEILDPDRFDELLWARLAAAGLGPAGARAAAAELPRASGVRRAMLLDWLRFGRAEESLPVAEEAFRDADWRVRRSAAAVVASLFGDEGGDEPGRRRLLRAASAATASPESLGHKRLADLDAALALSGVPSAKERIALLAKAGSPFDNVSSDALRAFALMVSSSPARGAAMAREEKQTAALLPSARALLRAASSDPDDEVSAAALQGLGGLGVADDSALLVAALESPSAGRREAAASGLARLGPYGRDAIIKALSDREPRTRALGALAAAQSWDEKTFGLLKEALSDRAASVRVNALAGVNAAQAQMAEPKKKLLPDILRLEGDFDAGVRASAVMAAATISPNP